MEEKKKEYTLRCLRCIGGRITVPLGAPSARCPHCDQGWRITWVTPEVAKIRGRLVETGESLGTPGDN